MSICTLLFLAMFACSSATPIFSLPSENSTIRLPVPSGKEARANLIAALMSV